MTKMVPTFMDEASRQHIRQSMEDAPDMWIEAARYNALWGNQPERFAHVLAAQDVARAQSLAEWRHEVSTHPTSALNSGGHTKVDNPDKAPRAYYIEVVVRRLLELVDAPNSIADDLKDLLRPHLASKADCRAALQKVLLEQPELAGNKSALSRAAGCDRRLVANYLNDCSVRIKP